MNNRFQSGHGRSSQTGVALLEALIAILVFSLGILTVISLQGASVKMAADAQLRSRAALLADHLVGMMWTSGHGIPDLKTNFESPDGAGYATWLTEVQNSLPGISDATLPTVEVTSSPDSSNGRVVIVLFWRTPSMKPGDEPHQHVVTSQISRN